MPNPMTERRVKPAETSVSPCRAHQLSSCLLISRVTQLTSFSFCSILARESVSFGENKLRN